MDVAAEQHDGRGRPARGGSLRHPAEPVAEPFERRVEGAPVLEVDRAAQALAQSCRDPAPASGAHGFVPGLEVVDPVGHEDRQRARDHQVVELAERVVDQPVPLVLVDHLPTAVAEHAGGAGIDDQQPRLAEVAVEGPAGGGGLAVPEPRRLAEPRAAVLVALDEAEQLLLGELRRREVADVLVDPVGHERAGDPVVPPRPCAHLLDPAPGDVPVVVDVVVVEDHRARHRREEPADVRIGPGLAIEPRVLLEVRHLLPRRLANVAPAPDELRGRRGDLVGVDLVAEEHQRVGPVDLAALQLARVRPQRIDARAGELVGPRRLGRGRLRIADPAGAEHEPNTALPAARVNGRERTTVVGRPDLPAVQAHVVGEDRAGLQVVDQKEREMVPLDRERLRPVAEHLDLAGLARLHPNRRLGFRDVAEHRAQDQVRHSRLPTRKGGYDPPGRHRPTVSLRDETLWAWRDLSS